MLTYFSRDPNLLTGELGFKLKLSLCHFCLLRRICPYPVIALSVGFTIVDIGQGVESVGYDIVAGDLNLARRSRHDGVGRNDGVLGDNSVASNDAIIADDGAIHNGGVNTN